MTKVIKKRTRLGNRGIISFVAGGGLAQGSDSLPRDDVACISSLQPIANISTGNHALADAADFHS